MPSAEDARNSMAAAINRIPETMEATRHALGAVVGLRRGIGRPDAHTLQVLVTLAVCVCQLDNRIERLEGRPGVPLEHLISLLREFGFSDN